MVVQIHDVLEDLGYAHSVTADEKERMRQRRQEKFSMKEWKTWLSQSELGYTRISLYLSSRNIYLKNSHSILPIQHVLSEFCQHIPSMNLWNIHLLQRIFCVIRPRHDVLLVWRRRCFAPAGMQQMKLSGCCMANGTETTSCFWRGVLLHPSQQGSLRCGLKGVQFWVFWSKASLDLSII